MIGILAIFTIGSVLVASIVYLGFMMKDPKQKAHAKNIFVDDGASASINPGLAVNDLRPQPLKTRLDQSIASAHPVDPTDVETTAARETKFNREKNAA